MAKQYGQKISGFSAVLAASIALSLIPVTAQRSAAPRDAARSNQQRNSQPPANNPSEPGSRGNATEGMPADNPRGTDYRPFVVEMKPRPKTEAEAAKEKADEEKKAAEWRVSFGLAAITTLILIIQSIVLRQQASITRQQNEIMETQSNIMSDTLAANRAVERGYVSLSPVPFKEWKNWPSVEPTGKLKIKNAGKTPLTLTNTVGCLQLGRRDDIGRSPAYKTQADHTKTAAFLVAGEDVTATIEFERFSDEEWGRFRQGVGSLWFNAYVDYIDKFGQRHRCGMSRRIDKVDQESFSFEGAAGFNYDRERPPGEGDDWEQG